MCSPYKLLRKVGRSPNIQTYCYLTPKTDKNQADMPTKPQQTNGNDLIGIFPEKLKQGEINPKSGMHSF
jgi:hypothetical protein